MEKLTFPAQVVIKTVRITFCYLEGPQNAGIVAPSFFFKISYFMKKWQAVKRAYFYKAKIARELLQISRSEIFGTTTAV